jgi:hypothetical protein
MMIKAPSPIHGAKKLLMVPISNSNDKAPLKRCGSMLFSWCLISKIFVWGLRAFFSSLDVGYNLRPITGAQNLFMVHISLE